MADELRLSMTKKDWLAAAENARTQKTNAKERYEEEKNQGDTDAKSFEQWVGMSNVSKRPYTCWVYKSLYPTFQDPRFTSAYREFLAKEAAYIACVNQVDPATAQEWQQERSRQYTEKYYGPGEDHFSQYLILTPEE